MDSAACIDESLIRLRMMACKQRVSKANDIAPMGFAGIDFDDLDIPETRGIDPAWIGVGVS